MRPEERSTSPARCTLPVAASSPRPAGSGSAGRGGPGRGKAAVGLHRAASLLYAHAAQLRRAGVLVVGPNDAFIRYIGDVLPALGEVSVDQMPLSELLARPRVQVRGADSDAAAEVKHTAGMASVIRRACYRRPAH